MARSRSWLVEHQYLLLRERDIRRLSIAARRHQERALFGHTHINMRGILTFDLSGYRSSLLRQTSAAAEGRASS